MSQAHILATVEQYYSEKLARHGPTARGVDWNSPESQQLRFEQLLKVCDLSRRFSLNDFGCGYGALLTFLNARGVACDYRGFDIAPAMIAQARQVQAGALSAEFFSDPARLRPADYTVASGIFNVRLQHSAEDWQAYALETVARLNELSRLGFATNMLTLYSDADRQRPDLYYADPLFWFDYCKKHFSRSVALLHDYPLYEFTLLVRKN